MFYKKGIDITNAKSMYDFLHNHYKYFTLNSWNCLKSVANNVKLYNLNLDGDMWVAHAFIQGGEYEEINEMIREFERLHQGYKVGFNGRSDGYLVLYNKDNNKDVLPDIIVDYDYEDFKYYVKDYYGSLKNYMSELVFYTKLVQDFDKLCDDIRDFVNELSKLDFKATKLEEAVEMFNDDYCEDLEALEFGPLKVEDGKVYVGYIKQLKCLFEAFIKYADRYEDEGYESLCSGEYVYLKEK